MTTKTRHWKLNLLAIIVICALSALGFWQLSRAEEKKILLKSFTDRTARAPITATDLAFPNDWRFYRLKIAGSFDNAHTFLLDNKTMDGSVGYEVYTPFKAKGMDETVLVDRGFLPMGADRNTIPAIRDGGSNVSIVGMLNTPPRYVALGQILAEKTVSWPLKVEYINLPKLSTLAGTTFYPYVLVLDPKDAAAFKVEWQVVIMGPERHLGYAVQWFALALTLLILSVVLNYRSVSKNKSGSKRPKNR